MSSGRCRRPRFSISTSCGWKAAPGLRLKNETRKSAAPSSPVWRVISARCAAASEESRDQVSGAVRRSTHSSSGVTLSTTLSAASVSVISSCSRLPKPEGTSSSSSRAAVVAERPTAMPGAAAHALATTAAAANAHARVRSATRGLPGEQGAQRLEQLVASLLCLGRERDDLLRVHAERGLDARETRRALGLLQLVHLRRHDQRGDLDARQVIHHLAIQLARRVPRVHQMHHAAQHGTLRQIPLDQPLPFALYGLWDLGVAVAREV